MPVAASNCYSPWLAHACGSQQLPTHQHANKQLAVNASHWMIAAESVCVCHVRWVSPSRTSFLTIASVVRWLRSGLPTLMTTACCAQMEAAALSMSMQTVPPPRCQHVQVKEHPPFTLQPTRTPPHAPPPGRPHCHLVRYISSLLETLF